MYRYSPLRVYCDHCSINAKRVLYHNSFYTVVLIKLNTGPPYLLCCSRSNATYLTRTTHAHSWFALHAACMVINCKSCDDDISLCTPGNCKPGYLSQSNGELCTSESRQTDAKLVDFRGLCVDTTALLRSTPPIFAGLYNLIITPRLKEC